MPKFDLKKLESKMLERGLTPRTLSDLSGVSCAWIYRIFSPRAAGEPTAPTCKKLADALGLKMKDIVIPPQKSSKARRSA